MKFVQVFLKILILIKILTCKGAATPHSLLANRRQHKLIEGAMDLEADPCEDFYQYACGNWENVHREAGDNYIETSGLLDYNANKELSRIFHRINLRFKPKFVKIAYDYYKSCKDLTNYETLQYIKWLKENENINLPTFWTPSKTTVDFDWLKTLAIMRIYGLNNILIEEVVVPRIYDVSKYIIHLDKPVRGESFKALTYEQLKLLVEGTGVPMTTRTFSKLWYEIKDFELKLIDLDDIEEDVVVMDNEKDLLLATVKDLPFPWLKEYLRIILNQTIVNPNMEIYVRNVAYMRALDELLKQYTQRFLCKYLELRFLHHIDITPPKSFSTIDCISSARSFLPMAMNWLYEQQHPELKQEFPKITELFENIRKHLNKTFFNNYYGFDASVVEFLAAKLNNIQLKINNIPRIDTVGTLEFFYKSLYLNASEFCGNHLKLLKFNFEAEHSLLNSTTPKKDFVLGNWELSGTSTTYSLRRSSILIVPLTLLQQPIYHVDLDNIYKYSSFGFLLAREIMHSFDDTGLHYDHKGKMGLKIYNAIKMNPLYYASIDCLLQLNPPVLDEKIADISSLPLAYQIFLDFYPDALTKYRKIYGRDISLSKLFFLNFAQFFCGTSNSEDYFAMTVHSSERDRVADTLSQFPEFSKVYQCAKGNRMHPHETCHMWRR